MPNNIEKPKLSYRKLAANRANAQKSTGPRTLKGKAISSQNGSKAPIFPVAAATDYAAKDFIDLTVLLGESRDEFAIVHQQFVDDYLPQSPIEVMIVEQMSRNHWNLLRFQASMFYLLSSQIRATTQGTPSERPVKVTANAAGTRAFEALDRAISRAQRQSARLVKELHASRRVRQEHAHAPGPLNLIPVRPSAANATQKNIRPNPPNESLILNFPRVPYTIALPATCEPPSKPAPSASGLNEAA